MFLCFCVFVCTCSGSVHEAQAFDPNGVRDMLSPKSNAVITDVTNSNDSDDESDDDSSSDSDFTSDSESEEESDYGIMALILLILFYFILISFYF
jgi:hypothetical protein